MDIEKAIEMIECAKINIENAKQVPALWPIVNEQLDMAIAELQPTESEG